MFEGSKRRKVVCVSDLKSDHVDSNSPIYARHDTQDCFVVSGVAVWTESARPPDRCVLCPVCFGVRPAVAAVAPAVSGARASWYERSRRATM